LTAALWHRWPDAVIEGLDSSAEMIAEARSLDTAVSFRVGDVAEWAMPADADVIVSNAVLQWVPDHLGLLASWAAALAPDAWLAFQVPGNFDAPSHRALRSLAGSARWAERLGGVLRHHDAVARPAEYATLLLDAGLDVDVWETTYLHLLPGADPVVQWLRGTGLRPVLAALPPGDGAAFTAELAVELRAAYPATEHGTFLPFRRIFAVAHRRPA
jgi:trans-aconitate 2-methyltransferase